MKRRVLMPFALVFLLFASTLHAQAPQGFNYQAVIRDGTGTLVTTGTVSLRFTVLQTSATGTEVYQETQSVIPNQYGLVTAVIGGGTPVGSNTFAAINWGGDSHYLKVEADPSGGNNFVSLGDPTMFQSVPYALSAANAATSSDNQWTSLGGNIYSNHGGNVGIGTINPPNKLSVTGNASFTGNVGVGITAPGYKLTTYYDGAMNNDVASTGTSDANAGFRLWAQSFSLDMGITSIGASYIVNRDVNDFSTVHQLCLNPVGTGGVSIGGYNGYNTVSPYMLYLYGAAYSTSGGWSGSDVRYKKNIQPIDNVLARVLRLRGVTYDFKTDEFAELNFDKGKQIGVIAQELEVIFPELVKTDAEGYKSVSYEKLTPVLIEAIKEQQVRIEALEYEISMHVQAQRAMAKDIEEIRARLSEDVKVRSRAPIETSLNR